MFGINRFAMTAAWVTGSIGASLLTVAPANAFTLIFDANQGSISSNNPATAATAAFDFSFSQQGGNALLSLSLNNTTALDYGSTLVGFALDLGEAFTYNSNDTAFTNTFTPVTFIPGKFGTYEFGARSGNGTFQGGNPQNGITAGNSATVEFIFENTVAQDLEAAMAKGYEGGELRAATRFQQVGPQGKDSDFLSATFVPRVPPVQPPKPIPEPGLLLGLGAVAAAGAGLRLRKS